MEDTLNIDNRVTDPLLWMLLTAKEKLLKEDFGLCQQTNTLPEAATEMDLLGLKLGTQGVALLRLYDGSNPDDKIDCMSADLLMNVQKKLSGRQVNGREVATAQADVSSPEIVRTAAKIGLRLQSVFKSRPQLVFMFGGEFYHWSGGWHESEVPLVLHWINKIAKPLIEMHDIREIDLFQNVEKEWVEHTDFIGPKNQVLLGNFYHHAVLQTRIVVLDRDPKELHDAN